MRHYQVDPDPDHQFKYINKLLIAVLDLLGRDGGKTYIQTNILTHYIDDLPRGLTEDDQVVKVGRDDEPIHRRDIKKALREIGKIPFQQGRSYQFEGAEMRGNTLQLYWGS